MQQHYIVLDVTNLYSWLIPCMWHCGKAGICECQDLTVGSASGLKGQHSFKTFSILNQLISATVCSSVSESSCCDAFLILNQLMYTEQYCTHLIIHCIQNIYLSSLQVHLKCVSIIPQLIWRQLLENFSQLPIPFPFMITLLQKMNLL